MFSYRSSVIILFFLLCATQAAYIHRVPGLMGDEASEGENVYQIMHNHWLTVQGERSYIGPLVDYARVPFILIFGYGPFALRLLMLLFSLITFLLAARVFKYFFDDTATLFALVLLFFSPVYLTHQRLGWAITLFPFFAFLLLYILTSSWRHRAVLAGIVAGLGLSNYLVFFPTVLAITVMWFSQYWSRPREFKKWWLYAVGFWAGFGTQFSVLLLNTEDQGNPGEVIRSLWERIVALPTLLPQLLSGSSYMAHYTGVELSASLTHFITLLLVLFIIIGISFSQKRVALLLWLIGLSIQLSGIVFMIDRFTLRYFVIFCLGIWALAGIGLATALTRSFPRHDKVFRLIPLLLAMLLIAWFSFDVLFPSLKTGGSLQQFSLGNRFDTASALVDTRPLVTCLRGKGAVFSRDAHIYNRLLFLSHEYSDLVVTENTHGASWLVNYRRPHFKTQTDTPCQDLIHFQIESR